MIRVDMIILSNIFSDHKVKLSAGGGKRQQNNEDGGEFSLPVARANGIHIGCKWSTNGYPAVVVLWPAEFLSPSSWGDRL